MPAWVSSSTHHHVIDALIAARMSAGLTQRDLAARLRKPPSFVGKIESLERNLSVLEFLAWCAALDASPAQVLPKMKAIPEI